MAYKNWLVVQIPYTWGYVDSINRIRRGTGKVVKVVSTGGNQKAKSGGMGRVFRSGIAPVTDQGQTRSPGELELSDSVDGSRPRQTE
jgi:hypothetical protein